MPYIILLNKPFNCLSQFTDDNGRTTLKHFIKDKPGFHVAGRLDYDSEGLLLLTDNGALQHQITDPKHKLAKTYWVQVEGEISEKALTQLRHGLKLKDGLTRPAQVKRLCPSVEDTLWARNPPIRQRQSIPTSWIELSIKEGKNRQVRRMTAATGYPTLRLIRRSIGAWSVTDLAPGQFTVIECAPASSKAKKAHNTGQKRLSNSTTRRTAKGRSVSEKTRRQTSRRYN